MIKPNKNKKKLKLSVIINRPKSLYILMHLNKNGFVVPFHNKIVQIQYVGVFKQQFKNSLD